MILALAFSILSGGISAAAPATRTALPPILREVEAKYAKAKTLEADFDQISETAATGTKKKSSGKLFVLRPNKVRWDTEKPDPSLLVSDGARFWFYTPPFDPSEHGQVIERKASEVQSKLADALLSGSFSAARDMKIQATGPSSFLLTPKRGSAGTVREARIEIDRANKLITKVVLEHRGGNRAEITLSKIELGKPLEEKLFHFVPPPGTERVRE